MRTLSVKAEAEAEIARLKSELKGKPVPNLIARDKSNGCDCRKRVNDKTENGELRQALSRSASIPARDQESLIQQARRRSYLRGRYVDDVRNALERAHWNENEVDFILYRSQHNHIG